MGLYVCLASDGVREVEIYVVADARHRAKKMALSRAKAVHFPHRPPKQVRVTYCSCVKRCEKR